MQRPMHRTVRLAVLGGLTTLCLGAATGAEAQILDRMKKRAEQQVQRRVDQRADQAVDRAVDAAEGAVTCVVTDRACAERAQKAGKKVVLTDAGGKPVEGSAAASAAGGAGDRPGTGAWVNFDFTPGERPIFVDDFTRDAVGDFPRRLELGKGNVEVAEWNGARWVRATSWPSVLVIPLPEVLPERFTVEMDVVPGRVNQNMRVLFAPKAKHDVRARYFGSGMSGGIGAGSSTLAEGTVGAQIRRGAPFPLRIMADGRYVKVYAGDTRIASAPNAELGRSNQILVELPGTAEEPAFVGNVRVMAGGRRLYDALAESGRVATQGIYFATGSAELRPESSGTLKEIATMLQEHADLRLTIEGHTDDVGDAATNRSLSEQRAAAVKAALVESYGVDAARLETAGLGDTKPAAPNATPEGRQQNRRVELVRM